MSTGWIWLMTELYWSKCLLNRWVLRWCLKVLSSMESKCDVSTDSRLFQTVAEEWRLDDDATFRFYLVGLPFQSFSWVSPGLAGLPKFFWGIVLWHSWLGIRKSIQAVKIEWCVVGMVICLERGADCLHMVQLMPLPSLSSLALFKSRLVLPFWYWLSQVVLEKRLLNWCSSS